MTVDQNNKYYLEFDKYFLEINVKITLENKQNIRGENMLECRINIKRLTING